MRRLLGIMAAGLVLFLFSGCASAPRLSGPDDCLVVIKVEMDNPSDILPMRHYYMTFSGGYGSLAMPTSDGYATIVVREPAVQVMTLDSHVVEGQGAATSYNFNFVLPYNPGHVVVLDRVFGQKQTKTDTNKYQSFWNFRPLTDQEKSGVMAEILAGPAKGWTP